VLPCTPQAHPQNSKGVSGAVAVSPVMQGESKAKAWLRQQHLPVQTAMNLQIMAKTA
jgi:hypothetical protein